MRPLPTIVLAAVLAAPFSAHAQTDAQRQALQAQQNALANQQRMIDSQRNLQNFEQNQRIEDLRLRTDSVETQLRTNQNLADLQAQRARAPQPFTGPLVAPAAPATPRDLSEAEARREASIAASEARLKALADQVNN